MNQRPLALASVAILVSALPTLTGCGAAIYHPRPSPRIAVTSEGSSLVLLRDGRTYGTGIFGSGIEEAVKGNARAEEEAHSYQAKGTAGFVLGLLGSLTSAGGAALIVGNEVQASPATDLRVAGLSMAFGGLALSIVGNVLSSNAQPHLWNAVNIYNDGLTPAFPTAPGYAVPGYGAPAYPGAPGYAPPPGYAPQQPGYAPQQPGFAPPAYAPRPAAPPAPPPVPPPAPPNGPVPPPVPPAPPH